LQIFSQGAENSSSYGIALDISNSCVLICMVEHSLL
jgi:hypothetical protein